jgi:hypothetical protein
MPFFLWLSIYTTKTNNNNNNPLGPLVACDNAFLQIHLMPLVYLWYILFHLSRWKLFRFFHPHPLSPHPFFLACFAFLLRFFWLIHLIPYLLFNPLRVRFAPLPSSLLALLPFFCTICLLLLMLLRYY